MTKRLGLTLTYGMLLWLLAPKAALADQARPRASMRERASTWLNPVRYHRSTTGQTLVEYGLENNRRVTLGATRQLVPSKLNPDGAQIQTVYSRLRIGGTVHGSRLRTVRTPDGLAKHTLTVRGFRHAEVKRLAAAGFDTSSIKAGTLKLAWQEKDQDYRPLTMIGGIGKAVSGSKVTRAAVLTTVLGTSSWAFGLLHTAKAAVGLTLATSVAKQIGAVADFRPRGMREQRMSTQLPGISEALSSMQNAAP